MTPLFSVEKESRGCKIGTNIERLKAGIESLGKPISVTRLDNVFFYSETADRGGKYQPEFTTSNPTRQ
jgi:hypothetical protein